MTVETVAFPKGGSNTTPAHAWQDFTFKTFAPLAFRYFLNLFGIRREDFMVSLLIFLLRPSFLVPAPLDDARGRKEGSVGANTDFRDYKGSSEAELACKHLRKRPRCLPQSLSSSCLDYT